MVVDKHQMVDRHSPNPDKKRSPPEVKRSHFSNSSNQRGNRQVSKVRSFFGFGNVEPREIIFTEMCFARYPSRTWNELTLQEQVDLIRNALKPRQLLFDPNCNYLKYWDTLVLCALLYTSIVTPYEVGFMDTTGVDGLFIFNRFIDVLFLKDMIMQFFCKIQVHGLKGTIWIKDRKTITKRYLKGWFIVDLFSILPFDVLGMVMNDPAVKKLRVVRIIRLLRLLKLVRVFRASRIVKRWQNRTSLSFAAQGLGKFGLLLTIAAHWMACIWGMVGRLLASDLICYPKDSPEAMNLQYEIRHTRDGGSWVTIHSWEPESPCEHFHVYIASLHFAVMTITSIGYGDIVPSRMEEYILCIVCQLGGGLTWASIIGSICGIIANANPMRVAFEQSMDALNKMLTEQGVEHSLRWKLREYLREQQYHHLLVKAMSISEAFSPTLRGNLILETAIGRAIKKVWYFSDCQTHFLVEVARNLEAELFSPKETVGGVGILSIVARGSIARAGRILLPGNFWGEDMIISSEYLSDDTPGIALSFAEVLSLHRNVLNRLIVYHPEVHCRIRKAAVHIAFRNAVRIVARELVNQKKESPVTRDSKQRTIIDMVWGIFDGMSSADETTANRNLIQSVEPKTHQLALAEKPGTPNHRGSFSSSGVGSDSLTSFSSGPELRRGVKHHTAPTRKSLMGGGAMGGDFMPRRSGSKQSATAGFGADEHIVGKHGMQAKTAGFGTSPSAHGAGFGRQKTGIMEPSSPRTSGLGSAKLRSMDSFSSSIVVSSSPPSSPSNRQLENSGTEIGAQHAQTHSLEQRRLWHKALAERCERIEAEVDRCRTNQSNVLEEIKSLKELIGELAKVNQTAL